jgi:hypothetical protein
MRCKLLDIKGLAKTPPIWVLWHAIRNLSGNLPRSIMLYAESASGLDVGPADIVNGPTEECTMGLAPGPPVFQQPSLTLVGERS